jgi:hypothetical protein
VATDAGANYAFRYYSRTRQGAEQDAIAQVAGDLPVGGEAVWQIQHTIPIGNESGRLRVVRVIDSPLATCKEVAFSVEEGEGNKLKRELFTTDICKQAETWKWASAEPAVDDGARCSRRALWRRQCQLLNKKLSGRCKSCPLTTTWKV